MQGRVRKFLNRYSAITLILLLSLFIRICILKIDLPNLYWHDEINYVETALHFGTGNFSCYTFSHGSLLQFILLFEFSIYFLISLFFGLIHSTDDFLFEYVVNPTTFYLIGRLTIMLLGVACVFLAYLISNKLYNKKVAILSSLFIGFSLVLLQTSSIISADIVSGFLLLCSFLCSIKIFLEFNSARRSLNLYYILSGVFIGLATAAKYYAIFGFVFLFVSHLFVITRKNEKPFILIYFLNRRLLYAVLAAVIMFFISMPWVFLNWKKFYQDVFVRLFSEYILYNPNRNVWLFHFTQHLKNSIGLPLEIIIILGIVLMFLMPTKKDLLLIIFPVCYFILLMHSTGFAYHWTPALPFLLIFAARTLDRLYIYFSKSEKINSIAILLLGLIVLSPTLFDSIRYIKVLKSPDTRTLAKQWIEKNIPGNASILIEGCIGTRPIQMPQLKSNKETLKGELRNVKKNGGTGLSIAAEIKYADIDNQHKRYYLYKVERLSKEDVEQFSPEYVITSGYFDLDLAELSYYLEKDYFDKRKRMYLTLENNYILIKDFSPLLHFRFYFPLFLSSDFDLLKQVGLFEKNGNKSFRGPEIKIFKRKDIFL